MAPVTVVGVPTGLPLSQSGPVAPWMTRVILAMSGRSGSNSSLYEINVTTNIATAITLSRASPGDFVIQR